MKFHPGWMLLACLPAMSFAQQPASPSSHKLATVTFQFTRPGLPVPRFTFSVDEEGHARYQGEEVLSVSPKFAQYATAASARQQEVKPIDRSLEVSAGTAETIFKTARSLNQFRMNCATKAKNIANTGDKILNYAGTDGTGSCTYNYSENKSVQALTELFLNITFTLDQGRKLEFDHRYDRLGLDEDMAQLVQAVEDKRALEIGAIADTLTAIIDDTAVLQRVRQRAETLVEQAKQTIQAER